MPLRIKLRDGVTLDLELDYNQMESIWKQQEHAHLVARASGKAMEWAERNGIPRGRLFGSSARKTAFLEDAAKHFAANRDPDRPDNQLWEAVMNETVTTNLAFPWLDDVADAVYADEDAARERVARALAMLEGRPGIGFLDSGCPKEKFRTAIGQCLRLYDIIELMKAFVWDVPSEGAGKE